MKVVGSSGSYVMQRRRRTATASASVSSVGAAAATTAMATRRRETMRRRRRNGNYRGTRKNKEASDIWNEKSLSVNDVACRARAEEVERRVSTEEAGTPFGAEEAVPSASVSSQTETSSSPTSAVDMEKREIQEMLNKPYKWGFVSDIQSRRIPKGLSEDTVRLISSIKKEPEWMLEYRLKAYAAWTKMKEPEWSDNHYPPIDFQAITYYAEPRQKEKKASLDEVDPELLETFEKLGIPITEQKRLANVAVDAVFDSVSIATTFREDLAKVGVIFCSLSEAIQEYPDLVKKYLGSVVREHHHHLFPYTHDFLFCRQHKSA